MGCAATAKRWALVLFASWLPVMAYAGEPARADQTLSPYFLVKGEHEEGGEEAFPLDRTDVHFNIAGVIADVKVKQTYRNRGKAPINATYVFPGSSRAAVHGLTLQIQDRVIHAKVKEKGEARQIFEKAKSEGKSASLLEQDRPNVFRMNVANILPGDIVQVELEYTELLVPTEGTYSLLFPTVVGPRYSGGSAGGSEDAFVRSPYSRKDAPPPSAFHIDGVVTSSLPLLDVGSASHPVQIQFASPNQAKIDLKLGETDGGNRDFTLQFRMQGRAIQSGLSLYEGADENFFLLMVQPPARPKLADLPPREYTFVLDVSGSMAGFPLNTAKEVMHRLAPTLRPQDRLNVMVFSGASDTWSKTARPATAENLQAALAFVDSYSGGGGTELRPALLEALALPHQDNISRTFVVVTDGFISTERELFQTVRENLGNANIFCFGIGSSVNHYLVDGLAKAGMGEPFTVTGPGEAAEAVRRFSDYVGRPVLTHVKLQAEGFDISDVEPQAIPDVLADRPIIVHGKWHGKRQGTLRISGFSGKGEFAQTFDVATIPTSIANAPLRYLWARSRIAALSDYGPETDGVHAEVLGLALRYNLLSRYTSFIAVDEVVRTSADSKDVKQPLPLPEGVEESAIEEVQRGDEPSVVWALALALAAIAYVAHRRHLGSSRR